MSIKLTNRKRIGAGKYRFDVLHNGYSTKYSVHSDLDKRRVEIRKQGRKVASCNSRVCGFAPTIKQLRKELSK